MTDTCRRSTCDNDARGLQEGVSPYGANFCSAECEVKHDHIKADARDARRSEKADLGGGDSTGVQDL